MLYYLYTSSDWSTTDELLIYDGCADQDDIEDDVQYTVVNYYLKRVLEGKIVPIFIEQSIQEYISGTEGSLPIDHRFVDEVAFAKFHEHLLRFMNADHAIANLYKNWTIDQRFPLVVVGENDISAAFLLHRFPPIERYQD